MADRDQIDDTYNYMDKLFRLSFGETPDITCALFDGDFSKSLERAQSDKHNYILDSLNVGPGARVLDIGCGWGGLLNTIQRRGARGIGLTLSSSQHASCLRNGLQSHLVDWRTIDTNTFNTFDAIACVGAFEHFCSEKQYRTGQQSEVYTRFFDLCSSLLRPKGRLFLQTMTWGEARPNFDMVSLNAPKGSDEYVLAVMNLYYPGSFLPFGVGQIETCSSPMFQMISHKDGRLDYIETISRWSRVWKLTPRSVLLMIGLIPNWLTSRAFRYKVEALRRGYNRLCFVRRLFGHFRIVLEKS